MTSGIRYLSSYASVSTLFVFGLILAALHFYPAVRLSKAYVAKKNPVEEDKILFDKDAIQHSAKTTDVLSISEEITETSPDDFNVDDFYKIDLVTDNKLVDKLSPLLKSNHEVIKEAQRIHLNMFKTLFGSYKYAMLFNFATNENKGDPAITVGELKLIKKLGLALIFRCAIYHCNAQSLHYAKMISNNYSSSDLVLLMQGGGNLMSYEIEDEHRRLVLERFQNFNTILFPSSLWLRSSLAHQREFYEIYNGHPRLTFLYRDRPSYELGKQLWPNVQPYLMPDMAFEIGAVSRLITPTHDIMWIKRHDKERLTYKIPKDTKGYSVIVQDWESWRTPPQNSGLEDAVIRSAKGFLFLQRGRVVITDRLHGHILSVLGGIPHVAIDPLNHKITSYMKSWTGAVENVVVANSSEDALNKAIELLQKLDLKIPKALFFSKSIENQRQNKL